VDVSADLWATNSREETIEGSASERWNLSSPATGEGVADSCINIVKHHSKLGATPSVSTMRQLTDEARSGCDFVPGSGLPPGIRAGQLLSQCRRSDLQEGGGGGGGGGRDSVSGLPGVLVKDYEKAVKLSRVQEHGPFVHHDRGKGAGCDTNLEQMDGNAGPIPWS
jgi:hypothetical protein